MNTNTFAARYTAELAKFADIETPGAARVFATYNLAEQIGITYEATRNAVEFVEAHGLAA